ncbi:transporter substrate-binding domain-containing protein [Romeria aff. gracilis LEGE 07310]|uniref:Transporter substrate-binding domain-containing protein n=1 Tax=Vasconcelosia minhoensis LEGE 07310 TaxID=915328 RepID=A0A8J7DNQ9_9CYAN|nr:transporter substrate-binding domain-containing protein [Romeria gracilis]MBE9078470.1 transporter substrate-binding domain-containing protein [Romeria aff. gracilis LEGE 07310]
MVADLLRAMFPKGLPRMAALFCLSLFLTVGIAACSGEESATSSVEPLQLEDIANIAPAESALATIESTGKVRVAVPADFPPFGFVSPRMQPIGYDIEMARAIAEGLGADAEVIPVVGNYRIPFLQTGRVDMIISSLGKNEERDLIIDFSEAYAPFFSGVYGSPDLTIKSIEDLDGYSIGVAQGALEDLEVSRLVEEGGFDVDIKRYANNSLTASALVSGQVNAIATGNVVAARLIQDNPDQQIESKFILKDSPCYVGVRENDQPLLEEVNAIIADLKQSGRLNEMSVTWFGEPLPEDIAST